MQIKTTMRHSFTPTKMAIIKDRKQQVVLEDVEKLETSYIAGGNMKWCSCLGKQSGSSSKG